MAMYSCGSTTPRGCCSKKCITNSKARRASSCDGVRADTEVEVEVVDTMVDVETAVEAEVGEDIVFGEIVAERLAVVMEEEVLMAGG